LFLSNIPRDFSKNIQKQSYRDIFPLAERAEMHDYYFFQDNFFYFTMWKKCIITEKAKIDKSFLKHKIHLKPLNKDTLTMNELKMLVDHCYPPAREYPKDIKFFERIFKAGFNSRLAYVQMNENSRHELAGLIYFVHDRAYRISNILILGCLEKYRRMGVGTVLIDYAIKCCRDEAENLDMILL
jgi:hypothetical protein